MNKSNISSSARRASDRELLLALLHEVYQLQRDLLDVRRALGIARQDEPPGTVEMLGAPGAASSELPERKHEDWNGDGPLF